MAKFKHSAARLLDRLASDYSFQPSKKEGYLKIAAMLEDVTDARAAWMADVLIGAAVGGEYADKLGEQTFLICYFRIRC